MKTTSCTIRLLNKTYEIKCPQGEEENLHLAAHQLNTYLQEKKRNHLDDFNALLLAALQVSHSLILCQTQQEQQRQQLSHFISSLENKIQSVATNAVTSDESETPD